MPSPGDVRYVRRRLLRWWNRQGRDFWWRHTHDPYIVAVVEILLKQTRASTVERAIDAFVRKYASPIDLVKVAEQALADELRPFGFHRQRAAHLSQFAQAVIDNPRSLMASTAELRRLPGLGLYSSAAVSVFAHGRRETVIDVNVVRVFSRVWGISVPRGELRKSAKIAAVAAKYASTSRPREANWALLDLGALVCTESRPKCFECPLRTCCAYVEATNR
jgi:A/G-specific adenine glycosylase